MEMKKVMAGWSKVFPGCNIGRKYPDSFIGKKVRNHWEKGCSSHGAYVEVYGSEESSPKKDKEGGKLHGGVQAEISRQNTIPNAMKLDMEPKKRHEDVLIFSQ